jgi:hypothetical protein
MRRVVVGSVRRPFPFGRPARATVAYALTGGGRALDAVLVVFR